MKTQRAKRSDAGKPRVKEPKTSQLYMACSAVEAKQIKKLARELGMSPSAYVRECVKFDIQRRLFAAKIQLGMTNTEAESWSEFCQRSHRGQEVENCMSISKEAMEFVQSHHIYCDACMDSGDNGRGEVGLSRTTIARALDAFAAKRVKADREARKKKKCTGCKRSDCPCAKRGCSCGPGGGCRDRDDFMGGR